MKTIVITRKYWGRYALRHYSGLRCCLGFVSEAFGVSPNCTLQISLPKDLPAGKSKLPKWLTRMGGDVEEAAHINDGLLRRPEKEKLLKELFAKHDIRLVFRGPSK